MASTGPIMSTSAVDPVAAVGGELVGAGRSFTSVLWRLLLVVFLALSFSVFLLKCGCFLSFIACWLSLCIRDIVFYVHYHMSQWVPSGCISWLEDLYNAAGHVQKWNSASLGDSLCFSECVIQCTHTSLLWEAVKFSSSWPQPVISSGAFDVFPYRRCNRWSLVRCLLGTLLQVLSVERKVEALLSLLVDMFNLAAGNRGSWQLK